MSKAAWVQDTLSLEATDPCRIVVLAEDSFTLAHAMERCGRVVAHLEGEVTFSVQPYRLSDLNDATLAHGASEVAALADILMFSVHGVDLSFDLQQWLGRVLERRTRRDGALAVIIVEPVASDEAVKAVLTHFHYVALRLGLEFLPVVPQQAGESGLAGRHAPLDPFREWGYAHWGLNE